MIWAWRRAVNCAVWTTGASSKGVAGPARHTGIPSGPSWPSTDAAEAVGAESGLFLTVFTAESRTSGSTVRLSGPTTTLVPSDPSRSSTEMVRFEREDWVGPGSWRQSPRWPERCWDGGPGCQESLGRAEEPLHEEQPLVLDRHFSSR